MTLTPEQFAARWLAQQEAALALHEESVATQKETLRVLKRLAAALAVNPETITARRAQARAEQKASVGASEASQQRRRVYKRSA